MPADIKLDQEITLKADEVIYEDGRGDEYLKIRRVAGGGQIEGVDYVSGLMIHHKYPRPSVHAQMRVLLKSE